MSENSLLNKLDGLVSRFEEVGTLITDPAVIADMKRFVKLNKEYRDLEKIVLSRAVTKHIERKILTYNNKTIIFS